MEEISFPSANSCFFFECFQLKYYQNLLGSKSDLTTMTFNSWTDTRQISAAPNSHSVSDSTCSSLKSDENETKWITFLEAKSRYFLLRWRSPAKAMRYADEALSFNDTTIRATQ